MSAGPTKRQRYDIVYRELQRLRRELETHGIDSHYADRQIFANQNSNPGLSFNISYREIQASNGEWAALPRLSATLPNGSYIHAEHLNFSNGFVQLVEGYKQSLREGVFK